MASFHLFWLLLKVQRFLFTVGWRLFILVYLAIGLGALAVVFLIEALFFMQVTQQVWLGYGIAAIFEIAKVGASVIKQALVIANRVDRMKVSAFSSGLTICFQAALMMVSLFCSVVIITAYLNGATVTTGLLADQPFKLIVVSPRNPGNGLHPAVSATLSILENGLHIKIKPDAFISGFALLLSALFQGIGFMVFGHLIAMQARELEHLFEVKFYMADAKKNSLLNP